MGYKKLLDKIEEKLKQIVKALCDDIVSDLSANCDKGKLVVSLSCHKNDYKKITN